MSGLRYIFKTLSLLRTTIILFIRYAPNCDFVRKNHQMRTRLKRLFKLCSLLIGSYNINIGPGTTNTMLTSFVTYSRLRKHDELTIKNHHQCHVRAAPLPEIHHNEKKASASKDSNPKKNGRSARRRCNRQKNRKLPKMMKRDGNSSKGNNMQCKACRVFKHTTEKCRTPKHLVTLYQKSLRKDKKV
jgi:hypothetical protein